jgi:hypothetical protein
MPDTGTPVIANIVRRRQRQDASMPVLFIHLDLAGRNKPWQKKGILVQRIHISQMIP